MHKALSLGALAFACDHQVTNKLSTVHWGTSRLFTVEAIMSTMSTSSRKLVAAAVQPQAVPQKVAELRPGTYVRTYGHMRAFQGSWSISAFAVRVVHDFNEVRSGACKQQGLRCLCFA
jgi:tRNA(Ile2) C34 agmatinyltransferase TiaS